MPVSASRILRLAGLLFALAGFCLLPPESLARGFRLCLWRKLFHLAACPACGSTRALAAFFHGRFSQALALNRNVVVTAPGLLALLVAEFRHLLSRTLLPSGLRSSPGLNRVQKPE